MNKQDLEALEELETALSTYVGVVLGDLWEPNTKLSIAERLEDMATLLNDMT